MEEEPLPIAPIAAVAPAGGSGRTSTSSSFYAVESTLAAAETSIAGFSIMQKGLMFGAIMAVVLAFVKLTRRRRYRKKDIGYEKLMA